jgi:hypothetical protein
MFCLKMHRSCHRRESDNQTTGAQQSRTKKTHEPSLAKANYANGTEPSSHCYVEGGHEDERPVQHPEPSRRCYPDHALERWPSG